MDGNASPTAKSEASLTRNHNGPKIRRRGRMTQGQRRALEQLAPRYLVDPEPNQWPAVFGRNAPLGVEIGFGMGQATLDWAASQPQLNIVGIEIYRPGIGALLAGIERLGLPNLRLLEGDAALLLDSKFEAGSLDEARILFPDPWPKKRHHKRRLIQPDFVRLLASRLRRGGRLLLATDAGEYAEWMADVLAAESALAVAAPDGERPTTRFEDRGRRLGHRIHDLAYQRKN